MSTSTPRSRNADATVWIVLWITAIAVGIFLRAYQLGAQIFMDDEWHAINKLLTSDYADIATHFGYADYSIPLTLFYKFLTQHGGLTEWGMRGPMLLSGVALIAIAPWLLRRQAGLVTLAVWSGLLAISPIMIYHSHVARPYAVTTLLVCVAVIAFYRWWTQATHRLAWGGTYVICTLAAGWLHLITLPFVLMPFVFFGIFSLWQLARNRRSFDGKKFVGLIVLGIVTAAALAAVLAPPLLTDVASLKGKSGSGLIDTHSVFRTTIIGFGISSVWLFFAMLALCVAGIVAWSRREGVFVAYVCATCLAAAFAIGITQPAWAQHPVTYARYLQPAIPFALLFVAEGFAACAQRLKPTVQAALGAAVLAGLVVAGPVPGYLYNPNQFMADPYFQFDYDPAFNPLRAPEWIAPVPDFYRRLSAQPPRSLTLIEAPWSMLSYYNASKYYQMADRQNVRVGFVGPMCGSQEYGEFGEDSGIRLRHYVHVQSLLRGEKHGDFLVMHRKPWPKPRQDWPDVNACLPAIEAKLGAPVYDDGDLAVFAITEKARALAPALR